MTPLGCVLVVSIVVLGLVACAVFVVLISRGEAWLASKARAFVRKEQ